jgi:hypothetical protein
VLKIQVSGNQPERRHGQHRRLRQRGRGWFQALAATIAAAFEQYRARLIPESGAFRESADTIARELADGTGAIIAEQDGETLGCVMTKRVGRDL